MSAMMSATTVTAMLGLSAAVIWGAGDFAGGLGARRLHVLPLITIAHGFSILCLFSMVWVLHQPAPAGATLPWGVVSGVANGCALLAFYRALSLGNMGVTAAISGLLSAALPVLFSLVVAGPPHLKQQLGLVLAGVAIWLISGKPKESADSEPKDPHHRQRWVLAIIAGCGFGVFLVTMKLANPGGLLWPLVTSKIGSLSVVIPGWLLFAIFGTKQDARQTEDKPVQPRAGQAWRSGILAGVLLALLAGTFDTGGNFLFLAATRVGRLDIAAVLSSLYPASTILLAAWLLQERTSKRQSFGIASAVLAVALIAW
ncbi:MAG TPA: hypothetical protein VMU62_05895 [Acidobacteriaceae bacterium]|nr:hypothetical protein [Acidobacteriaceae bacterium]